jgi:hypothetical protein
MLDASQQVKQLPRLGPVLFRTKAWTLDDSNGSFDINFQAWRHVPKCKYPAFRLASLVRRFRPGAESMPID